MFAITSQETYQNGQVIFTEGSPAESVYVVLSGSVEISKMDRGRSRVLESLAEGRVFGEPVFLGEMNYLVSARAVGETTLGILEPDAMNQEISSLSPEFRDVLHSLVMDMQKTLQAMSPPSSRTLPRIPKTLAVTFKDQQSLIKAYASDISEGGLFIGTEKPLEQGNQLEVKLYIPGLSEPMKINCEVAWSKQAPGAEGSVGMGVKFIKISEEDSEILKPYIRTIEKIGVKSFEMTEKDNQILKEYLPSVAPADPSS